MTSTSSRHLVIPAVAAIAGSLLFGCHEQADETQSQRLANRASQSSQEATAGPALTEHEVVGVLATAHESEILRGHLATDKLTDQALRNYAGDMIVAHMQAQVVLSKLTVEQSLNVDDSALAQAFSSNDSAVAGALNAANASADFDRKYVEAELSHHRELADLIDVLLLPEVHTQALRAELQQTRKSARKHLERAKARAAELPRPESMHSSL